MIFEKCPKSCTPNEIRDENKIDFELKDFTCYLNSILFTMEADGKKKKKIAAGNSKSEVTKLFKNATMEADGKKQKKKATRKLKSEEAKLIKKFFNDTSNVSAKDANDIFDTWMTKDVSEDDENSSLAAEDAFEALSDNDDSMMNTDRSFY